MAITVVSQPAEVFPAYNFAPLVLRASNAEEEAELYFLIDGVQVSHHKREFFSLASPLTDNFGNPITDNDGYPIPIGGDMLAVFDLASIARNFFSNALVEVNAAENAESGHVKSYADSLLGIRFVASITGVGDYEFTAVNAVLDPGHAEPEYNLLEKKCLTIFSAIRIYEARSSDVCFCVPFDGVIDTYLAKRVGPKAVSPYEGQYTGRTLRAIGDSFTAGFRATDFYGYVDMLCADLGMVKANSAIPGGQIVDMALGTVDFAPSATDVVVMLPGFNDCANFGSTDPEGAKTAAYKKALRFLAVNASIPENSRVRADASGVTYTGTWASGTPLTGVSTHAYWSCTQGSRVAFSVSGDVCYICYIQQFINPTSAKIFVDGELKGTINSDGYVANGEAISTLEHESAVSRIVGLGDGIHNIELEVQSATTEYFFFFQWAAGVPTEVSSVYLGNPGRENAQGIINVGNPNYQNYTLLKNREFKQIAFDVSHELTKDGLKVNFVDTDAYSTVYSEGMLDVDQIHPNDYGHRVFADAFKGVILSALSEISHNIISKLTPTHSAVVRAEILNLVGASDLEVFVGGTLADEIEVAYACTPDSPFYIRWINSLGGYEHWMFSRKQTLVSDIEDSVIYEPYVDTNADVGTGSRQLSLVPVETITAGAEGLTTTEFEVIRKMVWSPRIEYYDPELDKWMVLTIKKGTSSKDTRSPVQSLEFEFNLPQRAVQF